MPFQETMRQLVKTVLYSVLLASHLGAQSHRRALHGLITDELAGAIPGVSVTLVNEATQVARSTISNEEGLFAFPSVEPGTFSVIAEKAAFKTFSRIGVVVGTQQSVAVDFAMSLGTVTEVIEVSEQAHELESSTASGGTVLDSQKIADLPNSGRNPFMMAAVTPGVVPSGNPQFNRMQDQSGSSMIVIAGGPSRGKNYYLDGIPITDIQNRAIIIPTIESVMEVKVQSNTYDAEMGRTGSGTFNTTLKSGTNTPHGTGFGILREGELNANSFFNNRAGRPRPDTPYRNHGGSLGGPLWIPGVYDGRSRSFFHVAAEGYDQKASWVERFAVPSLSERNGDFSSSTNPDGTLRTIFDPATAGTVADGVVRRSRFPGNRIPDSRKDEVGGRVATHFARPNVDSSSYGLNNLNSEVVISDRARQTALKADHEFWAKLRANVSYLHYASTEPGAPHQGYPASPNGWLLDRKADATQLNAILIPSVSTVVSVRWGFNRFPNVYSNIATRGGFSAYDLGFPSGYVDALQFDGFPEIHMRTFSSVGRANQSDTRFFSRNFLTSVSRFSGRHTAKVGFDFRRIHANFFRPGRAGLGRFNFDDEFTRRTPGVADGTGSEIANLLLGIPESGQTVVTTPVESFIDYYAAYAQDDIRISQGVTLNLGLRVELESGLREARNNFTVDFDRNAGNPISNDLRSVPGGLIFAGVGGAAVEQGATGIRLGPRAGVVYRIGSKTVLRGGVGVFWAPVRIEDTAEGVGAIGYTTATAYVGSHDGGQTPANKLSDPFPNGLIAPSGNALGLLTGVGSNIAFSNPERRGTSVVQFSVDVQQELPWSVNLTVGYIGSRSQRLMFGSVLPSPLNINVLHPELFSHGDALLGAVSNPFHRLGGTGVIGGVTVAANQLLRPHPQFNEVRMYYGDTNEGTYDSLVVRVQRQYSSGLSFLGAFTWSRSFNASWAGTNLFSAGGIAMAPQNPYDLPAERAPDSSIPPRRFTSTASYALPFGRNGSHPTGTWVDHLAGGWQLNVVATISDGFPLSVASSNNLNATLGYGTQRPNSTTVSPQAELPFGQRIDGWFNPEAFAPVSRFAFGDLPRTLDYLGPGTAQWDLSVFRSVTLRETVKAQFRAEMINAFNTPQFYSPNTLFGNSSFGAITRQGNFPRTIQVGLRFIW